VRLTTAGTFRECGDSWCLSLTLSPYSNEYAFHSLRMTDAPVAELSSTGLSSTVVCCAY